MSRLRQLAMNWEHRAADDAAVAGRHELVRDEFRAIAQTRRNCAWELLRLLQELENENPNRKCTDCLNRMEMINGGPSFCVEHSSYCADIDSVACEYFAKRQA